MNQLRIQIISTYIPRECGIATYTHNLINAIKDVHKKDEIYLGVAAIDNKHYEYNHRVNFRVRQDVLEDYKYLADKINASNIDMVFLQHEYGIYGGFLGKYILEFLKRNKKPVVMTMHTVSIKQDKPFRILPNRFRSKTKVIRAILQEVDYVTVMTYTARKYLINKFKFPKDRIKVIPHGAPEISQEKIKKYQDLKTKLGFQKKDFILTSFGLINHRKGLEYVIRALPKIIQAHPKLSLKYLIVGQTHPAYPEEYLVNLKKLVKKLQIQANVIFDTRYLSYEQIYKYLANTNIFITPYYTREQASSGTLSYAIACGKCIVSTPYIFAYDLIKRKKLGELINFKDSKSIVKKINKLIQNPDLIKKYEKNSQAVAKNITWENTAKKFVDLFRDIKHKHTYGKK